MTRPLIYPLSYSENEEYTDGAIEEISSFSWPTTDNDERVFFTIGLSLNEYIQLSSSIDVGRDIAYPESSLYVWYLWQRVLIMSICSQVADCIENNEATQQAIANAIANSVDIQNALNQYLQDNGYGAGSSLPNTISPSQQAGNLLPEDYNCDDDHLCGMARWAISNLHDATLQLTQQLETATNSYEFLAQFVDNVEGVSYIGSIYEAALWAQEQFVQYYEAAYSTTVEDELTCALFCKMKQDCSLSLDMLIDFYREQATSFDLSTIPANFNDLWNIIDALDYSTATSKSVVAASHWLICQMMRYDNAFGAYIDGFRSIEAIVATGLDETDTYCATCAECVFDGWCVEQEFELGLGQFELNVGNETGFGIEGQLITALGQFNLREVPNLTLNRYYQGIVLRLGQLYDCDGIGIEVRYNFTGTPNANNQLRFYVNPNPITSGSPEVARYTGIAAGTHTYTFNPQPVGDFWFVYLDARCLTDDLTIEYVRMFKADTATPIDVDSNCEDYEI